MTLAGLLEDVPHTILQIGGGMSQDISNISIDSRKVEAGGLYICLLGLTVDGHKYIDDVVKAGVIAIVVEKYNEPTQETSPWSKNSGRIHPRPAGYDGRFQTQESFPPNVVIIQVENTRQAMAYIAANAYKRPAQKLKLIGVTGTNGKSTTTHFIEDILRDCGHKTGLIGTNGARVGDVPVDVPFATSTTPDPLELHKIFAIMLERGVKYVIMEVSSHALAFYKVEGLVFEVGVFTNLTQDHLDLHGTMDSYRLAKALLFAQSRFAVVNADDKSTPVMLAFHGSDPYITYGINNNAGLMALHIEYLADGISFDVLVDGDSTTSEPSRTESSRRLVVGEAGLSQVRHRRLRRGAPIIDAKYRLLRATGRRVSGYIPNRSKPGSYFDEVASNVSGKPLANRITINVKGRFNIYNSLAAIATCSHLGLTMKKVCAAKICGVPGRIQDVPNNLGVHVLVDYAHTPDGITNILSSVRDFTTGRVIIIFGCGGDRDATKRPLMGQIAGELADLCILTSDNPRTESPKKILAQIEEGLVPTGTSYKICENRHDAIVMGIEMLNSGDALIIAGKGHEDYQIIGTETRYFSDYETAQETLKRITRSKTPTRRH